MKCFSESQNLIASLPSANLLLAKSSEGFCVEAVSAGYLKLTGLSAADLLGKSMDSIYKEDPKVLATYLENLRNNAECKPLILKLQCSGSSEYADLEAEHAIIKDASGTISSILHTVNKVKHFKPYEETAELLLARTNHQALINGTEDIIWSVDKNLRVITANQAYVNMMKIASDKVFNEGDYVILDGFGEERTSRWKSYYERALTGVHFVVREEIFHPFKNRMQYATISFSPMHQSSGELFGVACFSKDTTKDMRQLSLLKESEKRYSDLFHLSPQPMWVYNLETLQFVDVNESAIRHYGYSRREFLAMTIRDIRPADELDRLEKAVESHRQNYDYFSKETFSHLKKTGELIKVEIQSNTFVVKGTVCRLVLIKDITERLNYLKAVENQNTKLKEIAWIQSHVVRAPLTRIMGLIDLVENQKVSSEEETTIRTHLLKSVNEIDAIIRDIILKAEDVQYDIQQDGN